MKRVLLFLAVVMLPFMAVSDTHLNAAKCVGADPCKACKNCKYCQHCAKSGKKCGVCKKA